MNAKKSVLCLIACLLGSQADAHDAQDEKTASPPSTEDRFEVRNLEGWTLYINGDVTKQYTEQTATTLEHLRWELYQIKLAAPALAVCVCRTWGRVRRISRATRTTAGRSRTGLISRESPGSRTTSIPALSATNAIDSSPLATSPATSVVS